MNEEVVVNEATKICLEYIYKERASNYPFTLNCHSLVPIDELQLVPQSYRAYMIIFQHIETIYLLETNGIIKIGLLPQDRRFPFEIDYEQLKNTFIPDPP